MGFNHEFLINPKLIDVSVYSLD